MTIPPPEPGDVLFLFQRLPYDWWEELPLALGPNVYLDNTPQEVLDEADRPLDESRHSFCPAFYLPAYGGFMDVCLRHPAGKTESPELNSSALFFLAVTALRLRVPLAIKIAGQFELGSQGELIKNPSLFQFTSPWQSDNDARYSSEDIHVSEEITRQLIHILQPKYKRLMSAATLFSQVTCGFSVSFQMSYLALFAALEALFVSKEERAKAGLLACRAATFLSDLHFPEPLNVWLKKEYKCRRNNLAHGVHDLNPFAKTMRPELETAFGRLHEVTRLCILGFMSLDNNRLEGLSQGTGEKLQEELDILGPATGRFLYGQRMWCA